MGISDRYYMNGTEESANYAGRRFSALIVLMAINVLVWLAWMVKNTEVQRFMEENFLVSAGGVIEHFRFHTLLTSAFSHQNLGHIFWNMLFFYVLGDDVERIYGYRNFFVLYIFCGVVASLAHIGCNILQHMDIPALGASGAVMGVAIVAAVFDPNRPMILYIITVPLKWLVTFYVLFDIFGAMDGLSPIAHAAHLGGALAGLIYYKLDLRVFSSPGRSDVGLWNTLKKLFRRKPVLRVREREIPEELSREPVAKAERVARAASGSSRPPPTRGVDAATSERVDELLGKISREGIGSLTDEERAFLKESSQKYRR